MKTKSSIFISSLLLISLFISCSKDESALNTSMDSAQQAIIQNDAALIRLGSQKISDSLNLEIIIPENQKGISNNEPLLLFPFYKLTDNPSSPWFSVPSVQLDNNFKIYYSRSNGNTINLIVEKFNSSEPYGSQLNLKDFNVIAIKPARLSGLTRNDLDVRNYTQMVEYFNLKN